MPVSPLENITDMSLRVTIKVDGSTIQDIFGIVSVQVSHEINRISHAEIVLKGEVKIEDETIPMSDGDDFKPGKTIAITAGYGSSEESIFKGVIVKHALEVDSENGYTLRLMCKHEAAAMIFNETTANFTKKTDHDIITAIVSAHGLSATVDSTSTQHDFVFQHLSTDWDFILSRAEFNGFIITLDGDAIKIGKPQLDGSAVLRLAVGDSVKSFFAELNAENQPSGVEAHAWDIKTLASIKSTATEPTLNSQGDVTVKDLAKAFTQKTLKVMSPTPMTTEELKVWADGLLLRKRLSAFKGSVKFVGSALAKTGTLVELENVGKKFNGTAFISSVKHSIEAGDWTTTVRIGLENTPVSKMSGFSFSPAGGQLPAIQGLQIGVVKKLSADPAGEHRIMVTIASNAETEADVWARYANFYASNESGSGFMPEVGDEVVVGFFDNDPRYPVILGSMYSSGKKSPNPAADENNYIKSITTKSKIKISMDDDKKVVLIETPGGNKITISDDAKSIEMADQNNNSVKMSSAGIVLDSPKDISIKATGNLTLDATGKVSISSKQDLALKGMNVTATADVGFTAKGNATAEVSASGQLTVKGGIVMIN